MLRKKQRESLPSSLPARKGHILADILPIRSITPMLFEMWNLMCINEYLMEAFQSSFFFFFLHHRIIFKL